MNAVIQLFTSVFPTKVFSMPVLKNSNGFLLPSTEAIQMPSRTGGRKGFQQGGYTYAIEITFTHRKKGTSGPFSSTASNNCE